MNLSSYLLRFLVSIALVTTPAILPQQFPSIAHAQTNSPDWSDLFTQARDLEYADQYLEAETIYRRILSAPRPASLNDNMYYYIQIKFGQILQTQGKFEEAIEVLQGVIDRTDHNLESQNQARRTLARVLESQQTAAQNVARGLEEIRQDATTQRGYFNLARGLAAQGQLANGFTFLETQLGRPLTPEAALQFARAANSQGVGGDTGGSGYPSIIFLRQEALSLFRQLVNRYPNFWEARTEYLDLLNQVGQAEETIAAYREAIRLQPDNFGLYEQLANNFERFDQRREAIALYQQLVAQNFPEARLYINLGGFLEIDQQIDRAIEVHLQGIQKFPENRPSNPSCRGFTSTSYNNFVRLLASENRLDYVLNILENSLPNTAPEIYQNLALTLAYRRHYPTAIVVNNRLKERYPNAESWEGEATMWRGGC